jgi:alanyl-tRNA synthetase
MEFYKNNEGKFSKLKQHNVDTGAGLERLTMAINGHASVYETDIYSDLNAIITGAMPRNATMTDDIKAKRTLADHLRAATFILSEGVMPDKNREGYIPRRLIRRSVAASSRLNIENFPYADAVDAVIDYSGGDYPRLKEKAELIKTAISNEQTSFSKILRQGETALKKVIKQSGPDISGQAAFNLTASHGIPLDILLTMIDKHGAKIDVIDYNASMEQHKNISRGPK